MADNKKPNDSENAPVFTVDHGSDNGDAAPIPDITSLLQRKSPVKLRGSGAPTFQSSPTPPPQVSQEKEEPSELVSTSSTSESESTSSSSSNNDLDLNISSSDGGGVVLEQSGSSASSKEDQQQSSEEQNNAPQFAPHSSTDDSPIDLGSPSPDILPAEPAGHEAAPHVGSFARKAKKRAVAAPSIIQWSLKQLATGKDPLAKGLAYMVNRGVHSALFLSIQQPPPGSPVPIFDAMAAVQAGDRIGVWNGLKWNPLFDAEMWNRFIKTGYVEFAPPGTSTNLKSARNVTRSAFGILSDEWLLFARIGPSDSCRGIIAMLSKKSLSADVTVAMESFSKPIH